MLNVLTSWLMKVLCSSSAEVRNLSFRLNLQVGILTPELGAGAGTLTEEVIYEHKRSLSSEKDITCIQNLDFLYNTTVVTELM